MLWMTLKHIDCVVHQHCIGFIISWIIVLITKCPLMCFTGGMANHFLQRRHWKLSFSVEASENFLVSLNTTASRDSLEGMADLSCLIKFLGSLDKEFDVSLLRIVWRKDGIPDLWSSRRNCWPDEVFSDFNPIKGSLMKSFMVRGNSVGTMLGCIWIEKNH